MRFLVLGAGAVGGYFGGRLAEAGGDVTFLLRPARAALLKERGLVVASPIGDFRVAPRLATAETLSGSYDVILLPRNITTSTPRSLRSGRRLAPNRRSSRC